MAGRFASQKQAPSPRSLTLFLLELCDIITLIYVKKGD